jgi:hypothetical protein
MCAGDFALLNFYYLNRDKQIYTWDDADDKTAYYYEKLTESHTKEHRESQRTTEI